MEGSPDRDPVTLVLIHGESVREVAKVSFGLYQKGPEKDRLPRNVYLVTSTRARAPYVLSLLLYVNPDIPWWRS